MVNARAILFLAVAAMPAAAGPAEHAWVWEADAPRAHLIAGGISGPMADVVETTLNGWLADAYGWTLPGTHRAEAPGLYLLVGDETSNPVIGDLVRKGLKLDRADLGDEGFRILTHEADSRRFVIVTANSPAGLKHGCQELLFFRTAATAGGAWVDWPMDVRMKPQFAYRGIYMLPCWAAHDSAQAWKRVLLFNSELTLNRIWFWLAGFPLLEQYGGDYKGTDLADPYNVGGLVEVCRSKGMKFYIGGGWFTWHHSQHANGSIDRGVQYYLDMLNLLPNAEGIYLEPAGEGKGDKPEIRQQHVEAFRQLSSRIWEKRPEFEFAIAIGQFNSKAYLEAMHAVDPLAQPGPNQRQRLFWWWCWGDPIRDNALSLHPFVLRWHTITKMSEYHGSNDPPRPTETALTGFATSYDPGMGFGNPWNGWGALGVDSRRELHPHTMPYFSHQYLFRERCWNVNLTEDQFAERLRRRLFDEDMPAESIKLYLKLAAMCPKPADADEQFVNSMDEFVKNHLNRGTPRNRDTLQRMREAVEGIRKHRQPK